MSGDELVVNVDQQEDRLLQDDDCHQQEDPLLQDDDRHNLATRSTSQKAMLNMIQTMQNSMRSLEKSVEKLQKLPPTRSNCSDDERRRDSDLKRNTRIHAKEGIPRWQTTLRGIREKSVGDQMNLKAVLTALAQVRAVQGNRTTAAMAMTRKVFFAPKHQLTTKLTIARRMLVSAKFLTSLTKNTLMPRLGQRSMTRWPKL